MDHHSLCCTVGVEELSSTGNVLKKATYPKVTVVLGRDEFKELQLQVVENKL